MLSKERGRVSKERLEYLSVHQGKAVTIGGLELSDVAIELLSLREQLEELKAWAIHRAAEDDARENDGYIELRIDYRQRQLKKILDDSSFTAAKPAEE